MSISTLNGIEPIGNALNVSLKNHSAWVAGVMSRKRQIIPVLEKVFDQHDK